jgi:hypothetical protein
MGGNEMRVLVCGGRSFDDLPLLDRTLNELHAERPITTLIHGGAAGADTMAHFWAGAAGVPIEVYVAQWKKYGKGAGPVRNQRMLDEGKLDLVVAFPGGAGTEDMMKRARTAGVEVIEIG